MTTPQCITFGDTPRNPAATTTPQTVEKGLGPGKVIIQLAEGDKGGQNAGDGE